MVNEFPPLILDTLTEIFNIGMGNAAKSLSEIIGKHIVLDVPLLELVPRNRMDILDERFGSQDYSLVLQNFNGDINGSATLFSPQQARSSLSPL